MDRATCIRFAKEHYGEAPDRIFGKVYDAMERREGQSPLPKDLARVTKYTWDRIQRADRTPHPQEVEDGDE